MKFASKFIFLSAIFVNAKRCRIALGAVLRDTIMRLACNLLVVFVRNTACALAQLSFDILPYAIRYIASFRGSLAFRM